MLMVDALEYVIYSNSTKHEHIRNSSVTLRFLLFHAELCSGWLGVLTADEPRIGGSQRTLQQKE